ncbi:MAG: winged helix-turn-helix transcriptional regulator [Gammaproteobacteria bacterium]
MSSTYGQYCPLALAAEVLCERWTLLVISRIVDGNRRFNEIHRGLPRMSATLLSQRLSQLERSGIVRRRPLANGSGHEYVPTPAGEALETIITDIAVWGQQWARDMTNDDLDPGFLLWSMHLRLNTAAMPSGRTVIEFEFTGAPKDCRRFWLVNTDGVVDMCLKRPGFEIDVCVRSDLRRFIEAWRGFRDLRTEIRADRILVQGPPRLVRRFPDWLDLSMFAPYSRLRAGRENRLSLATRRREGSTVRLATHAQDR